MLTCTFRRSVITMTAAVACLGAAAQAREIFEDFLDGSGGAAFDPELSYDFGTDTDFTGVLDTHDLFPGELWLYADLVTVNVSSLAGGEYIRSVVVTWTDNCGIGCTQLEIFGASSSAMLGNTDVSVTQTVSLSTADIGEPILYFTLSSYEGRIDEFRVTVVPTPSIAVMMLMGTLFARRRAR